MTWASSVPLRPRRVFLAVDDPSLRSALRLLLENEEGLAVVGEGVEAAGLAGAAGASRPELVLLSWGLARGAPSELVAGLRGLPSRPRLIALSARPEDCLAARLARADAFVCQGEPPEKLLAAVHGLLGRRRCRPEAEPKDPCNTRLPRAAEVLRSPQDDETCCRAPRT